MSHAPLDTVVAHLRKLAVPRTTQELDDQQLLERFAQGHDETSFNVLVQRHARLVWGVCRHLLGQEQDAEDAFQATFLVLAQRAASIRKGQALASWLHGVAYRIAMKARRATGRRRAREKQAAPQSVANPVADSACRELQAALDEEIARLPDKYRTPFILCVLEGRSRAEAAGQLDWKEGTVSGRLAEARRRLHARLARRGFTLTTVLAAAALAPHASAALPQGLTRMTIQTSLQSLAAGTASHVPATVAALARGAMGRGMMKMFVPLVGLVLLLGGVLSYGGNQPGESTDAEHTSLVPVDEPEQGIFQDTTAHSGIHFSYHNGKEAGQYTILETVGGGIALLDYDGDGLLDIFVTGGGHFAGKDNKDIRGYPCKLYKNLGHFKFKDVTHEVGLDRLAGGLPWFYTHGAAVADYDNDGYPDLLVTGYGRVALLHNVKDPKTGGRRFEDLTAKAGMTDKLWSTSAAWADFDGDGYPDVYLCHYVNWSWKNHTQYNYASPQHDVCPPKQFKALPHVVYRNNGDGTFTDVSKSAGILQPRALKEGKGLGTVAADFDGDGKTDLYVATDEMDNLLYMNQSTPGHIHFEEQGMQRGVARDDTGSTSGSFGATAGDYNGSGSFSLFITSYENETNALYRTRGDGLFSFCSQKAGLAYPGRNEVGFGTGFIDYDNDGNLDIFIANGHILYHPKPPHWREQRPLLFRNLRRPADKPSEVRFKAVSRDGGAYFHPDHIGRGAAFGDLDNDGRIDIVVSHVNEPIALLRNTCHNRNHWLGLQLVGKKYCDSVGAKLVLEVNGQKLTRTILGGGSYLSASDPRVVFGLGSATKIGPLTVTWPNGQIQTWNGLRIDRYHRLRQE